MNLLNRVKIMKPVLGSTMATAQSSTFIDMSGFAGCLFVLVSASTRGLLSTGHIRIQQATGRSTAGAWTSTFSNKVIMGGSSNRVMAVDVAHPIRQYLRLLTKECTGSCIIPICYGPTLEGTTALLQYCKTSNHESGVYVCTS